MCAAGIVPRETTSRCYDLCGGPEKKGGGGPMVCAELVILVIIGRICAASMGFPNIDVPFEPPWALALMQMGEPKP